MKTVAIHGSLFSALLLLSGTVFGSAQEEATIVAAPDTQYQAAVKANDYATMGRILADDFVVVLGTGEIFNKTDLIELARKGTCTAQRGHAGTQPSYLAGSNAGGFYLNSL